MEKPILIVKPSKVGCSTLRSEISALIDDERRADRPPAANSRSGRSSNRTCESQ
jgi:hypothetical protein